MKELWGKIFLQDRPSIGLSFFRIFVALTTGFHVLPSFVHLEDNYLHTAFKTLNFNFFTPQVIDLVQKSPDGVVVAFVWLFCVSWFSFLIGWRSQISCIVMTAAGYYFYALNAFHIGTLSWDILLVTLFLMCLTPYHGDYFSLDSLRGRDVYAYKRRRPFFLQRLLQIQIAFTYFYTALYKVSGEGNWLTDNPIYYLMHYPAAGVTKYFLLRDILAPHPQLCYGIGILIVVVELLMPFLLFCGPTRVSAIYLGFVFHIMLILTLDVPAIFFFLFPPQLLLFINPERIVSWVERWRLYHQRANRSQIVYDGKCRFCQNSIEKIKIMDLYDVLNSVDFQALDDPGTLHPQLSKEKAMSQIHLIEPDGKFYGGFDAFRRICWRLPMLYSLIPVVYFPGMGIIGPCLYRWVARNRYLFHANGVCAKNTCFR
ncbi:MAG: DUF393 domain-containing protein [Candidatus Omnitrophica bacterium]|nr:DUF393 domain-containing protein [Candidatus Omnitrophota bacterium]